MLLCQKVGSSQKLMETWQRTWKHTGVPICQNLDHRASKELTKNAILRNTHGSILKLKKKKKNLKRGAKALHYSRMSMMYKEKQGQKTAIHKYFSGLGEESPVDAKTAKILDERLFWNRTVTQSQMSLDKSHIIYKGEQVPL